MGWASASVWVMRVLALVRVGLFGMDLFEVELFVVGLVGVGLVGWVYLR